MRIRNNVQCYELDATACWASRARMLRFVMGLRIMSGSSVEEMVLVPVYDLLSSIHFVPPYFKTLRVPVQLPDYVQNQTV
jgi:hypothetical protein